MPRGWHTRCLWRGAANLVAVTFTDKSTPGAIRGRKARGLTEMARLPKERSMSVNPKWSEASMPCPPYRALPARASFLLPTEYLPPLHPTIGARTLLCWRSGTIHRLAS